MPFFGARTHAPVRPTIRGLLLVCVLVGASPAPAYFSGSQAPSNPLAGYHWFVDKQKGSWWVSLRQQPGEAGPLRRFADNPMGQTFASFVTDPEQSVRSYLRRVAREEPGSIAFLNLSRVPWGCPPHNNDSERQVDDWANHFSQGIGDSRVEIALETDRLELFDCLPASTRAEHLREIRYEVHLLHTQNPNAIVYVDAGSSDWGGFRPRPLADRLRRADVAEAQGFQVGASRHGWGPHNRGSSRSWHRGCVPVGEGVGIRPTVSTPHPQIDAFVWAGVPGYASGNCIGSSGGYRFYLSEAVSLARHANPSRG